MAHGSDGGRVRARSPLVAISASALGERQQLAQEYIERKDNVHTIIDASRRWGAATADPASEANRGRTAYLNNMMDSSKKWRECGGKNRFWCSAQISQRQALLRRGKR
jgi:hypothetical protein